MASVKRLSGPLWVRNISQLLLPQKDGPHCDIVEAAALFVENGHVVWRGPEAESPAEAQNAHAYDAAGCAVLPALVDCHTHLVSAGDRVADFDRRSRGLSYSEIAAEGGGIHTTVEATRCATDDALFNSAHALLKHRESRYGICTTEIKSGYALSEDGEIRLLEVVDKLRATGEFDLESTLLAAHVVPKDTAREDYVATICERMIPKVAARNLARFVDVFVEAGAYTNEEARTIFAAGRASGLRAKVHAEQITATGAAEMAAECGAVSADHLERISDSGLAALKKSGTVAVLLPGAMTYLGDGAPGLGRRLVDGGVQVAVATDRNPGSSPTDNLPLMATLAVSQMGLTTSEALRAITRGAAQAIDRDDIGHLDVGATARFLVLDSHDPRQLVASFGEPALRAVIRCDASALP